MSRGLCALVCVLALGACTSPEAERTRGSGPGADIGNRNAPVLMHEGALPYHGTPTRIPAEGPGLEGAQQAHALSGQ
jgi:hypothetical protein